MAWPPRDADPERVTHWPCRQQRGLAWTFDRWGSMTVFRSIVLLLSVVLCVAFAIFTGHGLARHETTPIVWGVVLLAIGAGLVFLQARLGRKA